MRRTKIVCTIGPASSTVEQLDRLAAAGMDVARLNFSHGTHAEHAEVIQRIREAEADRKSTRLNSSHDQISYAVFCLKKKKKKNTNNQQSSDTPLRSRML